MNELRNQMEDMNRSERGNFVDDKDDPAILKIALKFVQEKTFSLYSLYFYMSICFDRKAREGEKAASERLNEMEANYGDVIPRREFEQLTKDHTQLQEELELKSGDFLQLKEEHECVRISSVSKS